MNIECLKIIGTAHVSSESIEEVKRTIIEFEPQVVAVELDQGRYRRLIDEKRGVEEKISIRDAIKSGNIGLLIAGGFLTYFQRKIGEDIGVKPGSEMLAAIEAAHEVGARVVFIDRDIGVTIKRAINAMSPMEKVRFFLGILKSFIGKDDVEDIESLKSDDKLDEVMDQFREMSPSAYKVLVEERDAFMAWRLLEIEEDRVVAVVGAGHRRGIEKYLHNPELIPPPEDLLRV